MIPFPKQDGLDIARDAALAEVEAAVQALELREVPSAGRAVIYADKEKQAWAVKAAIAADETPDPDECDMVRRDMIADGSTIEEAADAILAAAATMRALAGPTEQWRRTRKVTLLAATTVAEVYAVDTSADGLMAAIAAELND